MPRLSLQALFSTGFIAAGGNGHRLNRRYDSDAALYRSGDRRYMGCRDVQTKLLYLLKAGAIKEYMINSAHLKKGNLSLDGLEMLSRANKNRL